jgi:transcriptional regulator with XRE-family HTH domain
MTQQTMDIGNKIKKLREIKGLKQEFMAEQLNISQQSYSNIENGKIDVPFSKLETIAEVLGIKIEDLISFDEKFILNNYGEIKGNQIGQNLFPQEIKQLYEDKIKLLEDKISLLEELRSK